MSVRFVPDGNPTPREWARIYWDRLVMRAFPIRRGNCTSRRA